MKNSTLVFYAFFLLVAFVSQYNASWNFKRKKNALNFLASEYSTKRRSFVFFFCKEKYFSFFWKKVSVLLSCIFISSIYCHFSPFFIFDLILLSLNLFLGTAKLQPCVDSRDWWYALQASGKRKTWLKVVKKALLLVVFIVLLIDFFRWISLYNFPAPDRLICRFQMRENCWMLFFFWRWIFFCFRFSRSELFFFLSAIVEEENNAKLTLSNC